MKLWVTGLLIGLAAGLLGALCGVGGGIVMVPFFAWALGMEHKNAVATSLAIVVVTAFIGTANHVANKTGLIDWRLVAVTAVGAAVAAWFGTDLMRSLGNQTLTKILGVLMVLVGLKMFFK